MSGRSSKIRIAGLPLVLALVATLSLSGCSNASRQTSETLADQDFVPVIIYNCGVRIEVNKPFTKVVLLDEPMINEVLSVSGVTNVVGAVSVTNELPQNVAKLYKNIPHIPATLAEIKKLGADLVIASSTKVFSKEGIGTRQSLLAQGIQSYLSPFACQPDSYSWEPTFANGWKAVIDIGAMLGQNKKAETAIETQRNALGKLLRDAKPNKQTVLWWQSGTDDPTFSGGFGLGQTVLAATKRFNVFERVPRSTVTNAWDAVVKTNPTVIVVMDSPDSTADEKISYLKRNSKLNGIAAVTKGNIIKIDSQLAFPGVGLLYSAEYLLPKFEKLGE